jgi:gamma-glutamyl hydrolase
MLWLSLGCKSASSYAPAEPVIGILTFPSDVPNLTTFPTSRLSLWAKQSGHNGSYVDSAYVRWLEMAGARVVAIPYDATDAEVRRVFARVNGVLFTGGPAKPLEAPPPYFETASLLYELVEEAWSRGETVPLWGTLLRNMLRCAFPLGEFAVRTGRGGMELR